MDFFTRTKSQASTSSDIDFRQSTLVLPIVSLANVAQLSADLLIYSLELERIGSLSGRYHVPLITPTDYVEVTNTNGAPSSSAETSKGFSTAVEVFRSKDASLTLIQQRSPVIKSQKDAFVSALTAFVQQAKFKRILLLAGMDAGLREDFDQPSPFHFLSASTSSLYAQLSSTCPPLNDASSTSTSFPASIPLIPSSGLSRRLLASLTSGSPDSPLDVSALLMSVAEGDNRFDAHVFTRAVSKVLGLQLDEERWREPISWKVGLYGRDAGYSDDVNGHGAAELYG